MVLQNYERIERNELFRDDFLLKERLDMLLQKAGIEDDSAIIAAYYNPVSRSIIANNIKKDTDRGPFISHAIYNLLSYDKLIELINRDSDSFLHYISNEEEKPHPNLKTISALDQGIINQVGEWHGYDSLARLENESDALYSNRIISSVLNKPYDMIDTVLAPIRSFVARTAIGYPYVYSKKLVDILYKSHKHGDNGALLFLHGHMFGYDANSPMSIGNPTRMLKGIRLNNRHFDLGSGSLIGYDSIIMKLIDNHYSSLFD